MPKESSLSKEFLYNEYVNKNKKAKKIAQETHLSYSYVQSKIKKFEIPRRRKYIDLTGKRFGDLTVLKYSSTHSNKAIYWLCRCDCGVEKEVCGNTLKDGETKGCGCRKQKGYKEIRPFQWWSIKNGAKTRNLPFEITIEYIWNLYEQQNGKCAISGFPITFSKNKKENTASLDRIDNNLGYLPNNIQWVHKWVNLMKLDLTEKEFFGWIKLIYENKNLKNLV